MSTTLRFIPTPAQLLLTGLGLAIFHASALAAPPPATVTFKVGQAAEVPSAEYMSEGNINPRTRDMKAAATPTAAPTLPEAATASPPSPEAPAAPAVASPAVGVEVGQAVPSYRTLGDAAQAGVNPLAPAPSAKASPKATVTAAGGLKSSSPYALIGVVLLFVGTLGYVVSRARARAARAVSEE